MAEKMQTKEMTENDADQSCQGDNTSAVTFWLLCQLWRVFQTSVSANWSKKSVFSKGWLAAYNFDCAQKCPLTLFDGQIKVHSFELRALWSFYCRATASQLHSQQLAILCFCQTHFIPKPLPWSFWIPVNRSGRVGVFSKKVLAAQIWWALLIEQCSIVGSIWIFIPIIPSVRCLWQQPSTQLHDQFSNGDEKKQGRNFLS